MCTVHAINRRHAHFGNCLSFWWMSSSSLTNRINCSLKQRGCRNFCFWDDDSHSNGAFLLDSPRSHACIQKNRWSYCLFGAPMIMDIGSDENSFEFLFVLRGDLSEQPTQNQTRIQMIEPWSVCVRTRDKSLSVSCVCVFWIFVCMCLKAKLQRPVGISCPWLDRSQLVRRWISVSSPVSSHLLPLFSF